MSLEEMQAKRAEAKLALDHYSALIIKTVELASFTGKEILDALKTKGDVPDGTPPDDLIAGILMDLLKQREKEADKSDLPL